MQKLSRRQILKAISALPAVSPATSVLAQASNPQPQEWTGFAICDSCNHVPSCGIQFQAQGNNIISIQNWKENPRHWLCSKGMSTLQRLYNPNRLLYPMKRTAPKGAADPGWVRITWDEAYKTIAANMLAAKKKYGPESVMFYAGDPKEPRPSIYRLARYFDSPTWATESSAACRSGCMMAEQLNFGQPNNGATPTKDTKVYMIMATNVWAQPLGWWEAIKAAKARGCKIITVDTRRTKAAEIADIHLAPAIGTDAALAAGIARVLIKENLINKPFIDQWTHGFEEYAKYVDQFTPEKTQEITGVPADKIVAAARLWAQGPGSFTLTTQSLSHNSNGVNNTRGLLLLPILMGYIDIPGGVPFGQPPKGLSMAAFGLHPAMADKKWWNSPEVKARRLDKDELPLWHDLQDQTSPNNLPEWVRDGKVKVFCGWGFNVNIWPQPDVYNDALSKLDFAFATDYFHRKDSHRNMDIILPAAMNYERHAPFGWYGPNIAVRKPIKPLGEAKEDWRIALELGCIVDKPEHFFDGDPEKALDFILHQYEGGDLVKFRNALPQISRIPAPKPGFKKYEDGRLRPDGKPGFNTLSGKLDFFSDRAAKFGYPGLPVYKPMTELSKDFDFRLMNGSRKPYITHSKTRTDQPYLMEIEDCLHVNINPKDAEARGIKEGDTILITSPYGGPVEAKAVVSLIVPVGTIDAQYGWLDNQNTQKLMNRGNRDPLSGYPSYFENPVRIEKKA